MPNRIITRGLGTSKGVSGRAGIVTQGFGGTVPPIIPVLIEQGIARIDRRGRSGTHGRVSEFDLITVWAKLVEVNSKPPRKNISGTTRTVDYVQRTPRITIKSVSNRTRTLFERFKVTVSQIKR